ncbi:MAG TPA: preprotein translocase subunit SecE [Gaiellaceae bacterium]|nr:preprotein translocase subunit SecE [Gaiellaceae bacterium]
MARQTRAQRRARREARERSVVGRMPDGDGDSARRPAPQPAPSQAGTARPAHRNGLIRFVEESIGELRKVEWPGQNQVVQGTVVVIIACVIIGTYLYVADQVFNKFVSKVLLGQ